MKTYKMIVAYDGTDYNGWQIQPTAKTVSGTMQSVFSRIFKQTISLFGASRTDTGVHALGQVVRARTSICVKPEEIMRAMNKSLPRDIIIRSIEQVDASFNPCANVYEKTYWYTLFLKRPLPMASRYGWHYPFIDKVDFEKFEKILKLYEGTHDVASFCKQEDEKSTIRTINKIHMIKNMRFGAVHIAIQGPSFMRFQIRRMIGYALDVAQQQTKSIDYIKDMLNNPNSQQTLTKAEGSGLCLRKVVYRHETD